MLYINAPIGIGKTSLAKILSHDLGTKAFLEEPEKIPLLSSFYEDGNISREMQFKLSFWIIDTSSYWRECTSNRKV